MILAVIVDAGLRACLKRSTVAVSPAGERVALASGKIGLFVGLDRDQAVVRDVVDCNGLIGSTKVAVVGDGDRLRFLAVNGGQGDITVDRDCVVRVILGACAVLPVEEDLALEGGVRTVADGGGCALAVAVGVVNRLVVTARGDIGHAVGFLAAELGIKREVVGDLGVRVEGLAALIGPAEEVTLGRRGFFGEGDGALVRNFAFYIVLTFDLKGDRMHRRDPLGVNDDVLRGHGAIEVESIALAQLVAIPAREGVAFLARGRGGSDRTVQSAEALLIFFGVRVLYLTVLKGKLVVVAGVVECGAVVLFIDFRTFRRIEGKAGDVVLVLFSDFVTRTWAGILVVQFVARAGGRITGLAGEHLYIVISSFAAFSGLGAVEIVAVQRHCFDVDLIGAAVRRCSPSGAAIIRRPLLGDVSAVFGGDGEHSAAGGIVGVLFFFAYKIAKKIALPVMRMLFFITGGVI